MKSMKAAAENPPPPRPTLCDQSGGKVEGDLFKECLSLRLFLIET